MPVVPQWLTTGALLVSLAWLSPAAFSASEAAALPDAATMLREVEAHQKQLDKIRENYTFRAVQTTRQLDSSGNTKKVETEEHEVFFVNGQQIEKLVRKDGKDLTPEQARKEQDRVNKEVLFLTGLLRSQVLAILAHQFLHLLAIDKEDFVFFGLNLFRIPAAVQLFGGLHCAESIVFPDLV